MDEHIVRGCGAARKYVRVEEASRRWTSCETAANGTRPGARLRGRRDAFSVTSQVVDDDAVLRNDWRSPHVARLPLQHPERRQIIERHDRAVERGLPSYADPHSGFSVFTADFLASRRYCCSSGCRHCPYVD